MTTRVPLKWTSQCLVARFLLLWVLFFPITAALAENRDVFVVPLPPPGLVGPMELRIEDQDLLINQGSGASIVDFVPTSRGELTHDSEGFIYQPRQEFWEEMIDHFKYIYDSGTGTVFLVAEALGEPAVSVDFPLEVNTSPSKVVVRAGVLGPGSQAPSEPAWSFRIAADEGPYLRAQRYVFDPSAISHGTTPGNSGGKIGDEIDPSALTLQPGDEVILARYSVGDQVVAELALKDDGTARLAQARGRQDDDNQVATDWVPLAAGRQSVATRWWPPHPPEARNGGVALEIGRRIAAVRTLHDEWNQLATPGQARVDVGMMGLSGAGQVGGGRFWRAQVPWSRLNPVFADGAESGDLSYWTQQVGGVGVTAAAAAHGRWGIEIPATLPTYVVDRSPDHLVHHYRARFALNLNNLNLPVGQDLTLFRGIDPEDSPTPFSLRLHPEGDDYHLCADTRRNDGSVTTVGCHLLAAPGSTRVQVQWWSASQAALPNGGLVFWIRQPSASGPTLINSVTTLDNGGQAVSEVHLGAIDPAIGITGTLFLDDFESWQ